MYHFLYTNHKQKKMKKGMTLLEILISLLIFSIVMATIYVLLYTLLYTPTRVSQILGKDIQEIGKLQSTVDKIRSVVIYAKNATAITLDSKTEDFIGFYLETNGSKKILKGSKSPGLNDDYILAEDIDATFTVLNSNATYPKPQKYVKVELESTKDTSKKLETFIVLLNSFRTATSTEIPNKCLEISF